MLCLALGELLRCGSLLRRVPLLIVRALCFRIRQSCFGRLARGHFPTEPLLEIRFAPRQLLGCCGGLCRSILPRSIEFRLEVAQPPFENVPGGRSLREARVVLCLTLGQLLRCGSLLRRVPLLIVRALCFRIRQACFGRLARGRFPLHTRVMVGRRAPGCLLKVRIRLREPAFERLSRGRGCGELGFLPGALLPGFFERRLGVAELQDDRVARAGGVREAGRELRGAPAEEIGRG